MNAVTRHVLSLSCTLALACAAARAQEERRPERDPIYDTGADAGKQIAEAVARAKKENRRVLIQWGANWCGWCHILHDCFEKDRAVKRKLLYEYDVVLVDVGRFDRNLDLVERYGADLRGNGIPFLTILDGDGTVVANQPTGPLEATGAGESKHDAEKVLEVLTARQAPYLSAESVLSSGLKKAREKDRMVFLHFGAPWCGWCHRLEDWMAKREVAKVLGREFVDVKIDVDRTIGGQELMARYRDEGSRGIPWFAVLSADGKVLVTSEVEGTGNLGCPWTPEEVAQFRTLLAGVVKRISAEEIRTITAHLGEKREPTPAATPAGGSSSPGR